MRVVFMGTPDFAVPALKSLISEENIQVVGVVTQPDKPNARGNKTVFMPVKEVALQNNLNILQPKRVKAEDAVLDIKALEPDLIVVVAYGQILSKEILEIPKHGCLNIHGSILPKYRGPAPIHWAVINGEKETGVTIMKMDEGLDTGDIILQKKLIIGEDSTTNEIYDQMSELGAVALIEVVKTIENGTCVSIEQDHENSTYAPLLSKDMGNIDWNTSSYSIKNLVRGLNSWPGAYTFYEGKKIKIMKVAVAEGGNSDSDHGSEAGEILRSDHELTVSTKDGAVSVLQLQMQGKKMMNIDDFLKGNKLSVGSYFKNI